MPSLFSLFSLLFLVFTIGYVYGHVSLTFPPARYPALDFLDNARTKGPCGVPKPPLGKGNAITLRSGSTFNVTWSLAYPHQGGFRIELLNDKDQPQYSLTPEQTAFIGQEDQTSQNYQVSLPSDFECENCGIRLIREAGEWGDYQFWSCADVNIIREPKETCQGHGDWKEGQCRCDRLHSGEACQSKDECWSDQDCGVNGKCEELRIFSFPRRVCYCKQGWFGENCNSPSPLQKSTLDFSQYRSQELGVDKNKLYWRILKEQNEIEMVLQYPSQSWIAIGWRPENIPASCANLERLSAVNSSSSLTSATNPSASAIPANYTNLANPSSPSIPDATVDILSNQSIHSRPSPVSPSNNSKTTFDDSDVVGELCYGDWRFPLECTENCDQRVSWTYVEDTDEIEFSIEAKTGGNSWIGLGFSATGTMNDADMIVVKYEQNKLEIMDMYSSGYTAPVKDQQQNISTGPVPGTYVNGVLRASFRRPRKSADTNDVAFTDTDCYHFLLTGGQVNTDGSITGSTTTPHVSKKKVCVSSCNPSALGAGEKYVTCDREFRFPPGCRPPSCEYMATWTYKAQSQEVHFEIMAKQIGRWTGIGFSREGNMTNSDIIMGWVYENGTYLSDRFAIDRDQPIIDIHQDIQNVQGRIDDDIQIISFSRKLITNDSEDISLKECLYYMFPVGGGRVLARSATDFRNISTSLGFHDQSLPKISRDLICICTDDGIPVNITSARFRRQAPTDPQQPRRPSSLPQGQSTVNITLGAQPIPIFDPKDSSPTSPSSLPPEPPVTQSQPVGPTEESLLRLQSAIVSFTIPPTVVPNQDNPTDPTVPPQPEPTANGTGTTPTSEPHPPEPEPKSEPKSQPEPAASDPNLHPMDCVDMVIGSAIGTYSRIGDYYSVSRATPKPDDYFGGIQSLTAATGYEENGITTIAFRRRLISSDPFDHNITIDDNMFVLWAKGQEYGNYSHNAPTGLDQGKASVLDFYTPDVLAYHGNKNRGSIVLNWSGKKSTDANWITNSPTGHDGHSSRVGSCRQEFVYPVGCKPGACHYNVTWMKVDEDAEFWLESEISNNHWTGIGFSRDGLMAKSDLVIITVNPSGPPEVTDRFVTGYETPTEDKKQNIFNIEASYSNGRLKAQFSRPMKTDDPEEDVDLNECLYFLYPYNGGSVVDHQVQKHSATPARSSEPICLAKCDSKSETPKEVESGKGPAVTKKPPELANAAPVSTHGRKFSVVLRILNHQWADTLAIENNPEREALAGKIVKSMENLLRSKFAGVEKISFVKFTKGSVIVELEVMAAGLNSVQLQEAITPRSGSGLIDGFQIDPNYVKVKEVQTGITPEEMRNYIIIGVASFLVILATAFAICMIIRTKRRRSKETKSNWNLVPFTPHAFLLPPSGAYPAAYQYPAAGPAPSFEYKRASSYQEGYSPDYNVTMGGSRQLGGHTRQYSSTATISPGGHGKTPSPMSDKKTGGRGAVGWNGETSYNEWMNRVTVGGQSQQAVRGQGATGTPYVQYPNDPYSYYTINGSQRPTPFVHSSAPRPVLPSGYYRQY